VHGAVETYCQVAASELPPYRAFKSLKLKAELGMAIGTGVRAGFISLLMSKPIEPRPSASPLSSRIDEDQFRSVYGWTISQHRMLVNRANEAGRW
jgi:hypothetical protein